MKLKVYPGIHKLILEGESILNGVCQRDNATDEQNLRVTPEAK